MEKELTKFIMAHDTAFETALAEIKTGKKRSHWMWYIFPQVDGLGYSSAAKYYSIKSREEAFQFYQNSYLGGHLITITSELLKLPTNNATNIFGTPDDMKLYSSMTLFYLISKNEIFKKVLDKFFDGSLDEKTIKILSEMK
jgi:uncharacterized protein (DUF1810 family)